VRARLSTIAAAAALLIAGCGGGGAPAAPPVQDHVHSAVPGHAPGEILLGTHYGLRISTDGGRTWPLAGDLGHSQIRLLVATQGGDVAVIGAADGSSTTRVSADGRRWSAVSGMPSGRPVSTLVPGAAPGSVWAEVTDTGIVASDDGGHSWHAVLPTPLTINDIAPGVDGPDVLAYASSAGVFLARGPQLTPLGDAPWLDGDVQSVHRWAACPRCVVASLEGAVATSMDGGRHWTSHPTTVPFTDVLSWAGGGATLLGVAPAPASPAHGLYLSTDAGATWTRVIDAPLVDHLYLPETPGAPLLAFRWGITVYRSTDGGRSWSDEGPLRG
jgi:photosystem II stability/assembly factor-like uncharacterized protein